MAIELVAEPRSEFGKQNCKHLRDAGRLPAVVYGGGLKENLHVSLDMHSSQRVMKANGRGVDYTLSIGGKVYPVRIGEVRREPIRKGFLHVDFIVLEGKAG
jgi:large subunit ribosomal protein L25